MNLNQKTNNGVRLTVSLWRCECMSRKGHDGDANSDLSLAIFLGLSFLFPYWLHPLSAISIDSVDGTYRDATKEEEKIKEEKATHDDGAISSSRSGRRGAGGGRGGEGGDWEMSREPTH